MSRETPPERPEMLVVSGVLPFPGDAGQQQRVRLKLRSFRRRFRVAFLTVAPEAERARVEDELREHCDEAIVLPARWRQGPLRRWIHPLVARVYAVCTGLKTSNYVLGSVELYPRRVVDALQALGALETTAGRRFDVAVFEYWHTHRLACELRRLGVPCVLDLHDLLWQARRRQLWAIPWLPAAVASRQVAAYRRREEAAWRDFDGLITINSAEDAYVGEQMPSTPRFLAPMGVDMEAWSFGPEPREPPEPPRLAYYGGLGSPHNRRDARFACDEIMPRVWSRRPDVELWIVGSRPPDDLLRRAEHDARLHVTGFVDDVQAVLRTMTAVLCPWTGTYGFRSRLVEVMALGVPVVASRDAVDGMEMTSGEGIWLAGGSEDGAEDDEASELARLALRLLDDGEEQRRQGRLARRAVEERYSFDATYGRLTRELADWIGP